MDDGQGLLVLAFVVIAFINWVSNTLKERAEQREAAKRRSRNLSESPPPAREQDSWPAPEPTTVSREEADPSQQLRDFFDSLSGNKPKPAEQPAQKPEPVAKIPAPRAERVESWKAPEVTQAALSAEELQALDRLNNAKPRRRRSSRSSGGHPLIKKLRTAGGAREAVLLAEVLGQPKGLSEHQPQA